MLAGRGKKSLSYNLLHNYGTGYMGWGYRATWCLLIDTNPLLVNSITRWMSHGSSSCQVVGNLRKPSYRLGIHHEYKPNLCRNQLVLQEDNSCPMNEFHFSPRML